MNELSRAAALEALLFVHGEPIEIEKIERILALDEAGARAAVDELEKRLKEDGRGLMILQYDNRIQLATKPEFSAIGETIMKDTLGEALTPAALETLAIVLYGTTVPRSTIEFIRGVNSSFILRMLLLRGLIERNTDSSRGTVYLYRPSFELLRHLGIPRVEDLPDFTRLNELIKKIGAPVIIA